MKPFELDGERMKNLMKINKISFQDLANMTQLSKATLHRYANNPYQKVPISRVWTIAFALNTTPEYLSGLTDDPKPYMHKSTSKDENLYCLIQSLNPQMKEIAIKFIKTISE